MVDPIRELRTRAEILQRHLRRRFPRIVGSGNSSGSTGCSQQVSERALVCTVSSFVNSLTKEGGSDGAVWSRRGTVRS